MRTLKKGEYEVQCTSALIATSQLGIRQLELTLWNPMYNREIKAWYNLQPYPKSERQAYAQHIITKLLDHLVKSFGYKEYCWETIDSSMLVGAWCKIVVEKRNGRRRVCKLYR